MTDGLIKALEKLTLALTRVKNNKEELDYAYLLQKNIIDINKGDSREEVLYA